MKHIFSSRKTIFCVIGFLVVILCIVFYIGISSGRGNTKNENSTITAELTTSERYILEKEIELKESLCDFDNENIVDAWVHLESSDNEITYANIFIVSQEEIVNKDELMTLASKSLNLDVKNISIESMDVESYTSLENKR